MRLPTWRQPGLHLNERDLLGDRTWPRLGCRTVQHLERVWAVACGLVPELRAQSVHVHCPLRSNVWEFDPEVLPPKPERMGGLHIVTGGAHSIYLFVRRVDDRGYALAHELGHAADSLGVALPADDPKLSDLAGEVFWQSVLSGLYDPGRERAEICATVFAWLVCRAIDGREAAG